MNSFVPSNATKKARPFLRLFAILFLFVSWQSGASLFANPPCTGDLVSLSLVYSGPSGVNIQVFRQANGSQPLASFSGVQTGDVLSVDVRSGAYARLLADTWFDIQDPNNPCPSANGCLMAVPSGCNSFSVNRRFGNLTVAAYTDENGQTVNLGLAGNGNRQVTAPVSNQGNTQAPTGNVQNRTIGLNPNLVSGSPRRNNGQGQAKSGADLDGDGLSYNLTTEELDVNPGDGIEINSDLVEVKATDLDGSGIEVINNNIHVNPGDGILLSNDEVTVNAADLEGAGLNTIGNNLEVNVDGTSIEIDPNDDLRIASGAAGDGLDGGSNQPLKVGDGAGIGVNANSIEVNVDGATIDIEPFSDAVRVAPGGITNNEVAVDAIATGNIVDGSVFPRDIASGGNNKVLTTDGSGGVVWQDQSSVQTAVADGDGLVVDFTNNETDVNPGDGIAVNNDQVEVVASDLEGDGLSVSNNDLNINAGDGIAINADNVEVNAADIDGDGLTTNNNNLSINPGPGIVVFGDQVIVNTNDLDGDGLGVNSTTFQLEVNTDNSTIETDGADNIRVKAEGITANEIGTGAVTTDEILDGTITTQDLGQNGAGTGQVLVWNGTAWVPATNDDNDADPTNEYNTGATLTGNTLNITDAGGTQTVDLSVLNNTGSDDQNLTGATLTGSDLTIDIENGTSTTADLSALEESADIAQVATDLQTHITNDGDLDATNEFQDLSNTANGTNRTIEITNGANTTIDVADNDNLPSNELQALSQTGNNVTLSQGGGTISVADNDNDASNELQTVTQTGNNVTLSQGGGTISVADNDNDPTNEYNTGATLTGNTLNITDAGGTQTVDLSVLNNTGSDDQNLTGATLTGTDLTIDIENGTSTTADLSALEESADIAQVATDLQTHITADGDLDATNEFQDLSNTASGTNRTIEITNGANTTIDVADNDNLPSNELQALSQTGNNVTLSQGGGTISVADNDNDASNELQTVTQTGNNVTLSQGGGTISVADNDNDPTNEYNTGATLTGNTLNITDAGGTQTVDLSVLNNTGSDDQNLTGATLTGTDLTIDIENGTSTTADLSALEESADIAQVATDLQTHITADGDLDATNEFQDLSNTASGTNRTIEITNGANTTIDVADNDNLPSNELQALSQTGNNVTLSQGGGTISVADNDNDASNELQTVTQTGNNVTLSQGGGTISVADNDNDPTNEYNTGATLTGNTLNITDAGGTQTVDLSVLNNTGSDDQNLTGATLTGTDLTIDIENGTSTTADLSALEESADIAQVATDLQTHITADGDLDATNEFQTLSQTGNTVTLSDGGGTINVADNDNDSGNEIQDLSTTTTTSGTNRTINISGGGTGTTINVADNDNDASNELQTVTQTGNNVTLSQGGGTISVADNDNDASNELQTVTQTGNNVTLSQGGGTISVADNDNDPTNEYNTGAILTGNTLNITDAGGTQTVDLSVLNNTGSDDQNLTGATLTGSDLTIDIENGTSTTADLSALEESADIAQVATDLQTHITNDGDLDATNEFQTLSQTGNTVTLSDGGGTINVADNDNDSGNEIQDLSTTTSGTNRTINISGGGTGTTINVADNDNDASNELQTVTQTGNNVTLSQGGGTISVADNDNDASNELQTVTQTGNNVTLSQGGGTISVADNDNDPTNEYNTGATLTGNTLNITDAGGTQTVDLSVLNNTGSDDQNLTGATLTGTDLTIDIENGTSTTADLSALEESADIAQVATDLQTHITNDGDLDATNEFQTLSQTGNTVTLSDGGGTINVADNDNDSGNEIQDLSTTTSGTNRTINISGGGTGTTISVADNDNDASNELQTVTQTGNNVTLSQGGGTISVADNDNDPTNEYNTGAILTGNTLNITDAGGTQTVDLSVLNNTGSDDQNLTGATLTGSDLTIDIENGTSTTADLSALEESADIAQVATDLQTHITNDGDLDATNEFQTLSQTGNTVTLSDGGGTINVADSDNDSGNEIQDLSTTTSGTNRTINISGGGTGTTINVADNDNDASNELQTVTQSGNNVTLSNGGGSISVADNDNDPTNEYNTGATLTGNTLNITDAGGTQTVDLSSLNNSGSDDQNLTGATLTGSDLTIDIENGTSTTADLSALEESADIAQVATDLQTHITNDGDLDATNEIQDLSTTTSGTNRTINISGGGTGTTINVADNDNDASNELQTVTQSGNNVTLSNGGGTISVADNDNDASNEIQNLTLSGSQLSISGGNTVTLPPDGDSDATNEIQDLSTTTSGTNRTINITGGTGTTISVADNDNDASNEIQNLTLSGSQLSISGGNTITLPPDGDSDATNEIQTISKSGSTVTLSDGGGSFTDAVNDADANATNELQTISKSGSTVTLSNGGGSFTDAVNDADASATNELNSTLNLNGNNLELTDAGGTLSVSLASLSDADPDPTNEFQDLSSSSSGTNRTIAITNGTNATINIADNDNDVTNEIQTLVQAGNNITLSNGGGTVSVADNDNDASNEIQNLGSTSSGTFRTVTISGGGSSTFFDIADNDNNSSNELQTISKSGSTVTLSNGGGSYTDAVNDADASATNELQNLSISGSTVSLSNGGGSVTIPATADNLGNHIATQNIRLGTNWLSGDGGNEGVYVLGNGNVGIGTNAPLARLQISGGVRHSGFMTSQGANYANNWMQFDEDQFGNSLILGSGGLTAIGSGESAGQVRINVAPGVETMYLSSDNDIRLTTNHQSGNWANRVEAMHLSNTGLVTIPDLAGSGNRMVIATGTGALSTLAIPVDTDDQDLSSTVSGTNRTINITNGTGTTISVADNDNNSSNELQTISKSGSTVTLSNGGGSFTDAVNDADASATNELQSLSISGSTISLNNGGGSVTVPSTADNLGNHTATTNLQMADRSILDANTIQANTILDIEDATVTVADNLQVNGNTTTTGDFVGRVRVQDTRATNPGPNTYDNEVHFEFKNRSAVGSPGTGTYGGMITLAPWGDNSGNLHHQMFYNDGGIYYRNGQPNSTTWNGWDRVMTQSALPDNSATNEIQNLSSSTSGTNRTINISGGTGTTISVADNDNSASNELQTLSISGSTISLTNGGGSVSMPSTADNLGNHIATTNLNMGNREIDNINYLDMRPGNGFGLRFWSSNTYRISMGNSSEYTYGPVTDYSIKNHMSNTAGRGWTWGVDGLGPVAAINTTGAMQIEGSLKVSNNNAAGGGLILSDDGGMFDRNDAYGTLAFSAGVDMEDAQDSGDHLTVTFNNSYPEISSYVNNTATLTEFKTGMYNNGGTFYSQNQIYSRAGIANDQGTLNLNDNVIVTSLAGAGNRMVVADPSGNLVTQAIPSTSGDNLGNHLGTTTLNMQNNVVTGVTDLYVSNWERHSDNDGIYWSNNNWHIYPRNADDMNIRTGNTSSGGMALLNGTSTRGYLHWNADWQGWLNNARQWQLRTRNDDGYSPNLYFDEEANESWTGNPGADEGKIEYHSNRFYIASGSNSTEVVRFRRSGSDVGLVANDGEARFPYIRDWNDTGYSLDLNSTSDQAERIRGGSLHGPNVSWGDYLMVGGNGRQNYINNTTVASVATTDGNLHMDAASGHSSYLNWYDGDNLYIGRGNNTARALVNGNGMYLYDGWLRPHGSNGLYFETYGGGWHMTDATWIRAYNNKSVHTPQTMQADVQMNSPVHNFGQWNNGLPGFVDGQFYRTGGNAELRVDDWFYMRDNDNQITMRFNTDEGSFRSEFDGNVSYGADFQHTRRGQYGSAVNVDFSGTTSTSRGYEGVHMEVDGFESGGFHADQDQANIWSPGDASRLLRVHDEDGMGTEASSERWYLNGSGTAFTVSDRNRKENIVAVENGLDAILALNGYTYDFKLVGEEVEKEAKGEHIRHRSIGVIAQEVEQVIPEAVEVDEEGNYFVSYDGLIPVLVEAVKEQQVQIEELKAEVADATPSAKAETPANEDLPAVDMDMLKEMQKTLAMQQALIQQQQVENERQQQLIDNMSGEMARLRGLLENTQADDNERFEEMLSRIYLSEQAIIELGSCCDDKGGENSLETGDNETLLFQNHPNPFNKVTTITYKLANAGHTELVIYDDSSLPVETVVNEEQDAGIYNIEWDGSQFTSGVYIYMLKQNDVVLAKKMVLIK